MPRAWASLLVPVVSGTLALAPQPAGAGDAATPISVTTTDDVVEPSDGVTSLREAVGMANDHVGDDIIVLSEGGAYTLSLCDEDPYDGDTNADDDLDHLDPSGSLTVEGNGATIVGGTTCPSRVLHSLGEGVVYLRQLTIRGGRLDLFDDISGGGVRTWGDLVGQGLVLLDNHAVGTLGLSGAGTGGGADSGGTITLIDSEVGESSAGFGGGLSATLVVLEHSIVRDSRADGSGGGIDAEYIHVGGASQILRNRSGCIQYACFEGGGLAASDVARVTGGSVVAGNQTSGTGGGVSAATVVIRASTVRDNRASGGGAGVAGHTVTVTDSTVADNVLGPSPAAAGHARGAGILGGERVIVTDSTVSGNRAEAGTRAGGIRSEHALDLTNSTVSGNVAVEGPGAGVSTKGIIWLDHATIVRNRGAAGSQLNTRGSVYSFNSLIGRGDGVPACRVLGPMSSHYTFVQRGPGAAACKVGSGTGDVVGVGGLGLGPLADNGGSTQTHLPTGSALSVIPNVACNSEPVDQRGQPRPRGGHCEAGSVEIDEP